MSQQNKDPDTDRAQSFTDYLDAVVRMAYDAGSLDAALDMLAAGPEPSTPEEEAAQLAAIGEAALQYGRSLEDRAPFYGPPPTVAVYATTPKPAVPTDAARAAARRAKAHEQDHGGHSH